MSTSKPKKVNLENTLKELEALINKMESNKLNLDESLACFEQGIKLIKICQKELDCAEQKIKKFTFQDGSPILSDFHPGKEIDVD